VNDAWKDTRKERGSRAGGAPNGSTPVNFLSRFTTNILDRNLPGSNLFLLLLLKISACPLCFAELTPRKRKK
jgi:hypothetical protein